MVATMLRSLALISLSAPMFLSGCTNLIDRVDETTVIIGPEAVIEILARDPEALESAVAWDGAHSYTPGGQVDLLLVPACTLRESIVDYACKVTREGSVLSLDLELTADDPNGGCDQATSLVCSVGELEAGSYTLTWQGETLSFDVPGSFRGDASIAPKP